MTVPRPGVVATLLAILLACVQGCGVSHAWDQTPVPVAGLPEQFGLDSLRAPAPDDGGCPVHLRDAHSGARLELVRSTVLSGPNGLTNVGDYKVEPAGSYGLASSQLLRVECPGRRPLGAVH